MVTFLLIINTVAIICCCSLLIIHIQLTRSLKELENREIELSEVVHEILKEDSPEEDTTKAEPKSMSPYEYAEMILRGKVDIENELRE